MRLTVGSVVAIFHDHLRLGRYRHQYDLMDTLLSDYLCMNVDYVLHPTAVSAWLRGRRNLPSEMVGYYMQPGGNRKLAATIAAQILPHMPDRALVAERIITLVRCDQTIHPATKDDLLTHRDDIAITILNTGFPMLPGISTLLRKVPISSICRHWCGERPETQYTS